MKNLLTTLAFGFLIISSANAQKSGDFNPIKVDISLGYAMPSGTGAKGGILFVVEPKYAVLENLSVGLRLETAIMARGVESSNGSSSSNLELKASGSYLLTGDYYFSDNRSFRPFAGLGLGLFRLAAATTATAGADVSGASSKFGAMGRAGFEIGHFRLGVEYNLVPDSDFTSTNGASTKFTSRNSYFGFKLGICFGGGQR